MSFFVQLTAEGSAPALEPNPVVPPWLPIAEAAGQGFGALFTAIGVILALWVAVWWEPRKARAERTERATQGIEESKRHREQLAEMRRAENDRLSAQARRIIVTTVKTDVLVENTWHVGIQNTSTDAISGLRVNVTARDKDGNAVSNGCRQAGPDTKGSVGDAAATEVVRNHQVIMRRIREDFDQFVQHAARTYESYGVGDAQLMLQAFSAGMANLNLDDSAAAALKEQVKTVHSFTNRG